MSPAPPSHQAPFTMSDTHNWHSLSYQETLAALRSQKEGLDQNQVEKRLEKYGKNQFTQQEKLSSFGIFIEQFKNFLVILLIAAAFLSLIIGEVFDSIAIFLIIFLNATVGAIQEYKAEQALQALKQLQSPKARVKRDNQEVIIEASDVVPGDILVLTEGDIIAADARIIDAYALRVNESTLTGESQPVTKTASKTRKKSCSHSCPNIIYAGTSISRGKGTAVVFATGDHTEFGTIAHLVQTTTQTQTPLQNTLARLGKMLGIVSIAVALPGMIIGILTGREIMEMVMMSISLAVSAIPEGLPVVVTITLAIGTRRLLKRRVLIRKLPAVEALGSTDVVCTDKTGTLTLNQMTVTEMVTPNHELQNVDSEIHISKEVQHNKEIQLAAQCALLCNDAKEDLGDPTERALVQLSRKLGLDVHQRHTFTRLNEVPFSSASKFMITLNQVGKKKIAFFKGAPEVLTEMCSKIQDGNETKKCTKKSQEHILKKLRSMSTRGQRVLALGYKEVKTTADFKKEKDFVFLGLVGMIDPPRKEVPRALEMCVQAGVRVVMLTGDHPLTAQSIAKQIGLADEEAIEGNAIDSLTRNELEELVEKHSIFARVSPTHKLKLLRALHNNGHYVAMTGDGVNDAPALKEAHIGIAVGSGTDLAKEVADMVLLDDNFATIIDAMYEGRGIFFNIKKFVTFLLAANFDEILVILAAIIFNTPLPLLPIHLLWLNVVTDSLPALALSVDTYEPDLMERKPYNPKKEMMHGVLKFSVVSGFFAFITTFGIFVNEIYADFASLPLAQTMTLTVTVLFELWLVFSVRSTSSAFKPGLFSNKWLNGAVISAIVLQLLVIYTPIGNQLFKTVPIVVTEWPKILLVSAIGFLIIESIRLLKYQIIPQYLPSTTTTEK